MEATELWRMLPFLLNWIQFSEITHLLVEFFVVNDHLRDIYLVDADQALATDKGLSLQRAWHCAGR